LVVVSSCREFTTTVTHFQPGGFMASENPLSAPLQEVSGPYRPRYMPSVTELATFSIKELRRLRKRCKKAIKELKRVKKGV
jgi:hypothetical protein